MLRNGIYDDEIFVVVVDDITTNTTATNANDDDDDDDNWESDFSHENLILTMRSRLFHSPTDIHTNSMDERMRRTWCAISLLQCAFCSQFQNVFAGVGGVGVRCTLHCNTTPVRINEISTRNKCTISGLTLWPFHFLRFFLFS